MSPNRRGKLWNSWASSVRQDSGKYGNNVSIWRVSEFFLWPCSRTWSSVPTPSSSPDRLGGVRRTWPTTGCAPREGASEVPHNMAKTNLYVKCLILFWADASFCTANNHHRRIGGCVVTDNKAKAPLTVCTKMNSFGLILRFPLWLLWPPTITTAKPPPSPYPTLYSRHATGTVDGSSDSEHKQGTDYAWHKAALTPAETITHMHKINIMLSEGYSVVQAMNNGINTHTEI